MGGVWNSYTGAYDALAHADIPLKVIVVRYEDVVNNPEKVLKRIATEIGARVPTSIRIIGSNARTFDATSQGRSAALDRLRTGSYRAKFSTSEPREMCTSFD